MPPKSWKRSAAGNFIKFFCLGGSEYPRLPLTMVFDYGGGKNSGLSCPSQSREFENFLFKNSCVHMSPRGEKWAIFIEDSCKGAALPLRQAPDQLRTRAYYEIKNPTGKRKRKTRIQRAWEAWAFVKMPTERE
jgi:hypothetical protein